MATSRLSTGWTWARSQAELERIMERWERVNPGINAGSLHIISGCPARRRDYAETLEGRRTTVRFTYRGEPVTVELESQISAAKNLRAITMSIEGAYLADYRGVGQLLGELSSTMLRLAAPKATQPAMVANPAELAGAFRALHLNEDAPPAVVSAAYRALSRDAHPDRNNGDATRQIELNTAYETLTKADRVGESG